MKLSKATHLVIGILDHGHHGALSGPQRHHLHNRPHGPVLLELGDLPLGADVPGDLQ